MRVRLQGTVSIYLVRLQSWALIWGAERQTLPNLTHQPCVWFLHIYRTQRCPGTPVYQAHSGHVSICCFVTMRNGSSVPFSDQHPEASTRRHILLQSWLQKCMHFFRQSLTCGSRPYLLLPRIPGARILQALNPCVPWWNWAHLSSEDSSNNGLKAEMGGNALHL